MDLLTVGLLCRGRQLMARYCVTARLEINTESQNVLIVSLSLKPTLWLHDTAT